MSADRPNPTWQTAAMGRTVAVLNQKGGVGKTTVTLGLASAAAHQGARVLVVDLDPQAASTWALGYDPADLDDTSAEVLGFTPAEAAVIGSYWSPLIDLLPASSRLQGREQGSPQRLRGALAMVSGPYDVVLVDCPPSLGNLTANALTAADFAIVVVEPSALGMRGIAAVADLIDEVWDAHNPNLELAGVIVNKMPAIGGEAHRRLAELTDLLGKKAVWQPTVPHRAIITEAIGARRSLHSYGARATAASDAFDQLWKKLRKTVRH